MNGVRNLCNSNIIAIDIINWMIKLCRGQLRHIMSCLVHGHSINGLVKINASISTLSNMSNVLRMEDYKIMFTDYIQHFSITAS